MIAELGGAGGRQRLEIFRELPRGESKISLTDGPVPFERVDVLVNGQRFSLRDLHAGEVRSIDVSSAMRTGTRNTILLVAHGSRDASAMAVIGD